MTTFEETMEAFCSECVEKECGKWWTGCAMSELRDRIEENVDMYGESERNETGAYETAEVVCSNCERAISDCCECAMWQFFYAFGHELPRK